VVVSRSEAVLSLLERALFARGAAVAVLQALPAPAQLRELLANGLIILAPPARAPQVDDAGWVEAVDEESPEDSARAALEELERRGVLLPPHDLVTPGGGI
jgi:hypothetical protein